MGARLPPWPIWAEKALQGLAFWIGHRHTLFGDHPLGEAALVAEACNLIYAHLPHTERLLCERLYRTLVTPGTWPKNMGNAARADLAVIRRRRRNPEQQENISNLVTTIIEVKRASASRELINGDLRRLATVKEAAPNVRALLFLVSEAARPTRFVSAEGKAILGLNPIPNCDARYRVRRACKATAAFSGKERAHYACLLEVFC